MVPELLILALDFYRAPLRYPHLASPDQPLPESFDSLIGAFAGALSPRNIVSTAQALGTSPEVAKKASLFFLRQVLLVPGSDHYRVLGLSPGASEADIREHYQLLVRIFHPDRSEGDPERNAEYTARINDAYNTLKKAGTRQRYDRQLVHAWRGRRATNIDIDRFRPEQPIASKSASGPPPVGLRKGDRRTTLLLLAAGGVVVTLVLALWVSSTRPVLRTNPELANASVAEPSFLRQRTAPESASTSRQHSESSRGKNDEGARNGTQEQESLPTLTTSVRGSLADFRFDESPQAKISRDEIRRAAMMGLTSIPEATDGAALEGLGKKAIDVLPSAGKTASPTNTPLEVQDVQGGKTLLAQQSNTAYSSAPTKVEDAVDLGKHDGVMPPADPPVQEPPPARPGMKGTQNAIRLSETKINDMALEPKGAADARAEKVVSTNNGAESVERIDTSVNRQQVQKQASAEEDGARSRPSSTDTQRAKTSEKKQEPGAKSAVEQRLVDRGAPKKAEVRPRAPPPEQTIKRMIQLYRAGNLRGLVNLFTADARTTDGNGKSAIRSDYAGLFGRTSDRRLSIRKLSWQRTSNGSVIGKGTYRAGTKSHPTASWRYKTGRLHIKLVPRNGGYKIAELFH